MDDRQLTVGGGSKGSEVQMVIGQSQLVSFGGSSRNAYTNSQMFVLLRPIAY